MKGGWMGAARIARILVVDEQRRISRIGRNRGRRARFVVRENAGPITARPHNACGPDISWGQIQVEVENFAAVLAFEETDLDRLGRCRRIDHRQQRREGARGRRLNRVIRVDQGLPQAVGVDMYRIRGPRHTQRADAGKRGVQRRLFERIHGG